MTKQLLFTIISLLIGITATAQTNYYVDNENGADSNDGLTEATAWKTINKVEQSKWRYQAGDSVLFKSGQVWEGQLDLVDLAGAKGNPIVFTSYGQGVKPHIKGNGEKDWSVMLMNCAYTVFKGFEITNLGAEPDAWRYGIEMRANNKGEIYGTEVRDCELHDINGEPDKANQQGGAILIKNTGTVRSRLVDAVIEGNHIHDVVRNGIYGNYNFGNVNPFRNKNVVIRKNLIERIPGDAIVAFGLDSALVEYNLCRDFTPLLDAPSNAAAGIWAFQSTNTIIQHNQVSGHQAKHDGQGYDADFNCENTIIQYNYSFDNVGGFVLICEDGSQTGVDNKNPIVRYNISIADGFRTDGEKYANQAPTIHIAGPVDGAQIYNNTIYAPLKPASVEKEFIKSNSWYGYSTNTYIHNNTFFGVEPMAFNMTESVNNVFSHNAYYGGTTNSLDTNPIIGSSEGNHYDLLLSQPESGLEIANNGGQDFFSNSTTSNGVGAFAGDNTGVLTISKRLVETSFSANIQGTVTNATLKVVNLLDSLVEESTYASLNGMVQIDASNYPQGVYFVTLEADGLSVSQKFIKVNEFVLPEIPTVTTFFDPLDNNSKMEASTSNVVFYTAEAQNFNGDNGRMARNNTETAEITYAFDNISNFDVEYWSWAYAGTGTVKVYASTDGNSYQEITTLNTNPERIGDRYLNHITADSDLSANGYNYLKVELSGSDANWKDQLASITITSEEEGNSSVAVTGVTLSSAEVALDVGQTYQLVATVAPVDATNQAVTWSSDNPFAVTVDSVGNINAVGGGIAVISATTEDGEFVAEASVIVTSSGGVSIPSNIVVTPTDTTAEIAFTEGNNTTYHRIQYRIVGKPWITIDSVFNGNPDIYELVDLQPATNYIVRMRAINATHLSSWSSQVSFTTTGSSARVSNLAIEKELKVISIFPNPATSGYFTVNLGERLDEVDIAVYNSLGKLERFEKLKDSIEANINIDSFVKGVYFIQIVTGNRIETRRLVVK